MKVEQIAQEKERIEIVDQAEQHKQNKFIGRIKVHKGQFLYELDIEKKMIFRPKTEAVVDIGGNVKNKYVIREGCLYTTAINLKNAERKFLKMLDK